MSAKLAYPAPASSTANPKPILRRALTWRWSASMSGTDCCSVHSIVMWCGSRPTARTWAPSAAASNAGCRRLSGVRLMAIPARRVAGGTPVRLDLADVLEDGRDDVDVELHAAVGVDRRLDDRRDRLREHRHLRPEQALVFVQLARRDVDDRLERDDVELPQAEEVVEHLGLDDLGRLGHADPVGQAGQQDRRRHRDDVAIGLGQRVVDRDEAVFGSVRGVVRDLRGQPVGQRVDRADQDRPGLELEQAATDDASREAAHEPDVPRPEQSLRRGPTWRGLEPHFGILRAGPRRGRSYERPDRVAPWSGAVRWGPVRSARQSLSGADRQVEPVLGRRERAGPLGSNAHDGWNAKLKSTMSVPVAGSPPRSALLAASTR